jgi:SAM-dependent methyltransferase
MAKEGKSGPLARKTGVIQHFRHWLRFNLSYFGSPPWDTGITPPELVQFCQDHPAGRALDLGCGTGTNLVYLARAGWQVTGVEFALKAVRLARRKLRVTGLPGTVLQGDAARVTLPSDPFTLILDIGCFHGLPADSRPAYRQQVFDHLAAGGTFLIYLHLNDEINHRVAVGEDEITAFQERLALAWRQDSLDRFGRRASWLAFERRS